MESLLKSTRRIQSACWLVKLRWAAIAVLGLGAFFAKRAMGVSLPERKLYFITGVLFFYNFILFDYIRQLKWGGKEPSTKTISRMIMFQISADLFILTAILHFSGGIENPFCFFFVFHMIIASILCLKRSSYIQAALAISLFSLIVLLECFGILNHYELTGFAAHGLYKDFTFISGTLFVFSCTLILVVYMTTSIVEQLREQEEGVEQANEMLEEKDKIKNEYVLRVTHDIKGHLAAIESCINLVYTEVVGPLNEKQKDLVGRAYRRTLKCMSFITALLKITRLNLSGKLEKEIVHINRVISSAITTVQNRANQKNISLNYEGTETVYDILGEQVLIEETLTNLLFNAIRYTPSGGRIVLTVKDKTTEYLIQISDTGIGIPKGDEEKIFEEFYRSENAKKAERDGTGLGLSFAKQAIEKHSGKIWAQSNPDGGSTFSFTLPKPKDSIPKK
ncbi:MAG: HAMP domain-containing histidine kinase [Sedimentisphaerales bacterium]|nr:HAMP domain-containing histidine kinase [Sedimentisphaerales bacterium]